VNLRLAASLLLGLWFSSVLAAEDPETLRIVHRFNWSRFDQTKYRDLAYGYMSGSWKLLPSTTAGWTEVEARYYQATDSLRDYRLTEKPLEAERRAQFRIDPNGVMSGFAGDGVPYYRNFPAPLPAGVGPGSVWTGTGELVADFLGTGFPTRIPILIEYRYDGPGTYGTTPVLNVKTQYALRYLSGQDPQGDPSLTRVDGKHLGTVSYDAASHKVVLIQEKIDEQYSTSSGKTSGKKGGVSTFFEGVPALGTASMVKAIAQALEPNPTPGQPQAPSEAKPEERPTGLPTDATKALLAGSALSRLPTEAPDVKVAEDPRGVKLTLENLKFVADQAVLLPGEDQRLRAIADLLKNVPDRDLLVVGHTAAVGTPDGQEKLSLERALSIVAKLKAAGVPAQRLLYEGRGAREPLASNTTDAGRAQNRRVEIIILDQ